MNYSAAISGIWAFITEIGGAGCRQASDRSPASLSIDCLFREDVLPRSSSHELVDSWRELLPQMKYTDELGGFQLLEVRSSLPDELLMYADKLSMAHSLEARVPYLDRTVVEYV